MLINNEIIDKWKSQLKEDKYLLKKINKIKKNKYLASDNFFDELRYKNNKVIGKYDVGYSNINKITMCRLFHSFIENIGELNYENDLLLIASDGSKFAKKIADNLLYLQTNRVRFITFDEFQGFDKKIITTIIKKIKIKYTIYIEQSIFDNDLLNVYFLDDKGTNIDSDILQNIITEAKSYDEFNILKNNKKQCLHIDTNLFIKSFVDKILKLSNNNDNNKSTKITIANHNQGVTNILTKIIGKLDYSYTIYNKAKKKNIYCDDWIDNDKFKKIYHDEIRFTKKNKSNFLITFNENGSNLLIFLIYKNQVIFLNETLITLIFLHHFLNEIDLNNKKIPPFYIASNQLPINSIQNMIKKYNLNFQFMNNVIYTKEKYMLYYWNSYNQYIFGEKVNTEFSIYHLIIRILQIINYYNLQNNSINSLLSKLEKMYGASNEMTFYISKKIDIIENFMDTLINNKEMKKAKNITSIFKHEYDSYILEEFIMYTMSLEDNTTILIKYNTIINKCIFIFRNEKNKSLFNIIFDRYYVKKMYKNIFDEITK